MKSSQLMGPFIAILSVQAVTDAAVLGVGRLKTSLAQWFPYLVSGAAGVLLATACLDLLPEAAHASGGGLGIWEVLLATLLALFCFQAWVHGLTDEVIVEHTNFFEEPGHVHTHAGPSTHRHSNSGGGSSVRAKPAALVLGSGLHSLVDGIAIVAAFTAGPRTGWSAALAIGLHELPHRMGDFALLVHMGVARRRALALAIVAGAMAVLGGGAAALLGQGGGSPAWLLPVSAGTFLYIALVDLFPELHSHQQGSALWRQTVCLLAGAGLVALLAHLPGE